MMPLNTHVLNSAPRNLVSRVTSLTNSLQSVVMALAVAGAATILQSRLAAHTLELGEGPASASLAFDDTFRMAAVGVAVAWLLATTLRRVTPGSSSH